MALAPAASRSGSSPLLIGGEHSDDLAVVTYAGDGKVTSLNAHGVLLLGFRESDVVGTDVWKLVCPDILEDEGEAAAQAIFGLEQTSPEARAASPRALPDEAGESPDAGSPRSARPTQSVTQLRTMLRHKTDPSFAAQLHVHMFRVPIPKAARVAGGPRFLKTFACTFSHADGEEMMASLLLGEQGLAGSPLGKYGDSDDDDIMDPDLSPKSRSKLQRARKKKKRKEKPNRRKLAYSRDGHHHHHHHHAKALFIDMEELEFVHDDHRDHEMTEDTEGEEGHFEWHETARWKHGLEEQVVVDEEEHEHFAQGRVSSIPFHAIVLLRMALLHGEVAIDLDVSHKFGNHMPEDPGGAFANAIFMTLLDRMERQHLLSHAAHDKALDTLMRHHHHKGEVYYLFIYFPYILLSCDSCSQFDSLPLPYFYPFLPSTTKFGTRDTAQGGDGGARSAPRRFDGAIAPYRSAQQVALRRATAQPRRARGGVALCRKLRRSPAYSAKSRGRGVLTSV